VRRASLPQVALGVLGVAYFGPLLFLVAFAVMARDPSGGVALGFTLEHYLRIVDPLYLTILARTVLTAALCTAGCVVLGYPVAAATAVAGRWRPLLLFLVTLPLWTSALLRTFALVFLLRGTGPVNSLLAAAFGDWAKVEVLYTPFAVQLGLVSTLLPLMVLPIYQTLSTIDPVLLEAALVHGATPRQRFLRVTWPLSLPGVATGALLVFVSSAGSFVVSDMLGGARTILLGNVVRGEFGAAHNWPFGSALAVVLVATCGAAGALAVRWRDPAPRGAAS
jgi:spermidine/putrescine transport system permease protein